MRNSYKFIAIVLVMSFPVFCLILSELYSYYYQPMKYEENVPAEVLVVNNKRGVRYELAVYVYMSGRKAPSGFVIKRSGSLGDLQDGVYGDYINKKSIVSFYYKTGVCKHCPLSHRNIPISIYNKDTVFLDEKKSEELFFYDIYNVSWFLLSCALIFSSAIYWHLTHSKKV